MKETANITAKTLKNDTSFIGKKKAMFKMIKRDEVPQDYYLSEIVGISWGTIKDGKRVLEVCYKIEETYQAMLRTADALEDWYTPTYKYVKEIYIEGRYRYRYFKKAMEYALEKSEFQFTELLGVKEFIGITFFGTKQIGRINARTPYYDGFFDDICCLDNVFDHKYGANYFE